MALVVVQIARYVVDDTCEIEKEQCQMPRLVLHRIDTHRCAGAFIFNPHPPPLAHLTLFDIFASLHFILVLHRVRVSLSVMSAPLRFLIQNALSPGRLIKCTPVTSTATLRCLFVTEQLLASQRRGFRTSHFHFNEERALNVTTEATLSVDPSATQKTSIENPSHTHVSPQRSTLRHNLLGFTDDDLPHLVHLQLPRASLARDVEILIARAGLQRYSHDPQRRPAAFAYATHSAKLFMYYSRETGRPANFCFLKIADKNEVKSAIESLSRFTLLGVDLKPKHWNVKGPAFDPKADLLVHGWLPSPSAKLEDRIPRGPVTQRPKLLDALLSDQWVMFVRLPPVGLGEGQVTPLQVMNALYEKLHQYDVLWVTPPREHPTKVNGWFCRILFGSREEALKAREMKCKEPFHKISARFFRGGSDIHKALLKYQESLPANLAVEEVGARLDEKYSEIYKLSPAEVERHKKYPFLESAVGLKSGQTKQLG